MKELSKQELQKKSREVFKYNPELKALAATTDGQFFPEQNKQHAREHARKNGLKTIHITRDKGAEPDPVNLASYTVKETEEWAGKQTDVTVLKQGLETVDTKGGKEALENRIEELNASE